MRAYGNTNAAPYASAPAVGLAGDTYWNTTEKVLYVSDGAAWIKADTWTASGATLTPTDATKEVYIPTTTPGHALKWGPATIKSRLIQAGTTPGANWSLNGSLNASATAWVQDDGTKPSWVTTQSTNSDTWAVARCPAGVPASMTNLLSVDATGNFMSAGHITTGGVTTAYTNPGLRITGTAAGIRCQNVGTALPDAYSNSVAFGWDGTLKARIDSTQIGTVTVTSDARVKRDIEEDVPGLDTVQKLRPVSFEYDQAARPIGFEPGRHYGLIAQELAPHLPLLLREEVWDAEKPDETRFALQAIELIPVLIQAIKDLAARVAALETAAGVVPAAG
jgi:hypothetical protein